MVPLVAAPDEVLYGAGVDIGGFFGCSICLWVL